MADWFEFKGIRSTSLGVKITKHPNIPLAKERVTNETIPGRSGSLTTLEGAAVYDDVVVSIPVALETFANLDAVAAWLRGAGDLVLGDNPGRCYKARCSNQMDLAKVFRSLETREFNAVFRCAPYRYTYPAPAAYTLFPFVNRVSNGNFANTTGWVNVNANQAASSNKLQIAATGTGQHYSQQTISTAPIAGHKYYARVKVSQLYLGHAALLVFNRKSDGSYDQASAALSAAGTLATVITATSIYSTPTLLVQLFVTNTADATSFTANGEMAWFEYAEIIDLTAILGSGNEPDAATMSAWLEERYDNGWFNGTASGGKINNLGTADATPLITVVGSGDIDLAIGGKLIHIDALASQITIDTDSGISLDGSGNDISGKVTMAYPWTIPPGTSAITWTGTVTSVTIARPWRYI